MPEDLLHLIITETTIDLAPLPLKYELAVIVPYNDVHVQSRTHDTNDNSNSQFIEMQLTIRQTCNTKCLFPTFCMDQRTNNPSCRIFIPRVSSRLLLFPASDKLQYPLCEFVITDQTDQTFMNRQVNQFTTITAKTFQGPVHLSLKIGLAMARLLCNINIKLLDIKLILMLDVKILNQFFHHFPIIFHRLDKAYSKCQSSMFSITHTLQHFMYASINVQNIWSTLTKLDASRSI